MNQRLGWFSLFFWSPHGLVRIVGLASWLRHSNTKIDTSWQFPLHMASKIILTQSNNHPRFFAENQTNPKCPLVMCVGGMCVCGGGVVKDKFHTLYFIIAKSLDSSFPLVGYLPNQIWSQRFAHKRLLLTLGGSWWLFSRQHPHLVFMRLCVGE